MLAIKEKVYIKVTKEGHGGMLTSRKKIVRVWYGEVKHEIDDFQK